MLTFFLLFSSFLSPTKRLEVAFYLRYYLKSHFLRRAQSLICCCKQNLSRKTKFEFYYKCTYTYVYKNYIGHICYNVYMSNIMCASVCIYVCVYREREREGDGKLQHTLCIFYSVYNLKRKES